MEIRKPNPTDPYHDPHGCFTRLDTSRYSVKYLDLPYHTQSEDQKLDLYLPEERTGLLPVVIYIHGGGYEMGDRKYGHIERLLDALQKGYAVASVSYRLSQEQVFPAAVQDVRNGIRYLRKHGPDYGIDPDRMGLLGESAGGNLVALLAMDPQEPVFDADIPEPLQGVSAAVACAVDWFGVVDITKIHEQNRQNNIRQPKFGPENCPESRYIGQSLLEADPAWMAKTNPITYITPQMCPMLIEHGTGDFQVPVQQSQALYHAIVEQLGRERAELFLLEDAIHEDPRFEQPDNMAIVWSFFQRHLQEK
jgi:acetyl esterase/lipase